MYVVQDLALQGQAVDREHPKEPVVAAGEEDEFSGERGGLSGEELAGVDVGGVGQGKLGEQFLLVDGVCVGGHLPQSGVVVGAAAEEKAVVPAEIEVVDDIGVSLEDADRLLVVRFLGQREQFDHGASVQQVRVQQSVPPSVLVLVLDFIQDELLLRFRDLAAQPLVLRILDFHCAGRGQPHSIVRKLEAQAPSELAVELEDQLIGDLALLVIEPPSSDHALLMLIELDLLVLEVDVPLLGECVGGFLLLVDGLGRPFDIVGGDLLGEY